MARTQIEWTEYSWNPITGCAPVSEGCEHCYAQRMAKRLAGRYGYPADEPFKVNLHLERTTEPLRWKKPRRVFVCSMGDPFHPDVPDEWLDQIFGVMLAFRVLANMPDHTFMVLTKRPARMKRYFTEREPVELIKSWAKAAPIFTDDPNVTFEDAVYSATCHDWDENGRNSSGSEYKPWGYIDKLWPLPNVWLGATAENQARADERIPILLQIPAAVRFVSVEPMLGPVNLEQYLGLRLVDNTDPFWEKTFAKKVERGIDWVICGGETGPGARPMHPDWVRSLRDQCQAAGVPLYFKSWGDWIPSYEAGQRSEEKDQYGRTFGDCWVKACHIFSDDQCMVRVGKKKAGRILDGRTWDEMPPINGR